MALDWGTVIEMAEALVWYCEAGTFPQAAVPIREVFVARIHSEYVTGQETLVTPFVCAMDNWGGESGVWESTSAL